MYACHLMKNSAFKLRGKKSRRPDPSLHNDTSVKILFKIVKVQYCTAVEFVRKRDHVPGTEDLLPDTNYKE